MSTLVLLHFPVTAEGFVMGFLAGIVSAVIVIAGRYFYKKIKKSISLDS